MDYFEKITSNPLFLKLKNVIENNPWHDNESVYDHLLKTYKIASEKIKGDFISDEHAKKLFVEFVNEDFDKVKRKDLILITALTHDIGKILYYKEENVEQPLRHENQDKSTRMPGHEYWGSTIIPELLKNTGLMPSNIEKIAKVVRLHDTFSDTYFGAMKDKDIDFIVDDIKARAEGLYVEALFNIYCDVFSAKPSKDSIKKITEVFNQPSLYTKREYFIK